MESPPERPTCLPAGTYPDLPPDSPMSADGVANRLFGGACHQHREAAEALLSSPLPWNDNTLESVFASGERCLDSRSYAEYFERWRRELYRDIDCSNKAAYTPDFIEHLEAMKEQRQKEEEKGSERAEGHSKRMSEDGKGSSREGAVDAVTGQSTEEDGEGREGGGLASASSSYANIPDALLENQWGLRLMDFVKLARETGATHHQLDQRGNASGRQSQSAFSTHSGGGVQRGSVPRVSVTSSLSPPPFGTRGSLSAASASGGPRGSLDAAPAAAMGRLSIQSFTGQGGRHRSRSRGSSVVSQQGPGFRSHSIASSAGGPSGLFSKYEGPLLQGAVKGYDLNLAFQRELMRG
uniref:Uncharacterized protein n=1 Tax=Chromera velia CCMP2878 TaxID=1169474 RepID=A0A0G4F4D7_9ALVE|eukprot:Cvel_153.t1-p1 / transcript=Cvel_153.t1 / gene=Cvel_153 / organism=Chromera_velia_CCMP2878 / gene_product=hypothetical protein / transcript_product=hypothetical protein / location=Cvel_scaffold10:50169-52701(-) / protein_length=351 / sequence_SO=supercontig / SO=protein_coding / is_pseudo=false